MSKKLLEADMPTVDLRSIINGLHTSASGERPADEGVHSSGGGTAEAPATLPSHGDWKAWGELLQSRLDANKSLDHAAKHTEYEIELKFFEEFFNTNWESSIAENLLSFGDPLRKALKILKFDIKRNPILAFINLTYVQNKLILPGLLNANTFRAIYNAVADRLVASSEFMRARNYNIIYCPDLYTKPLKEIIEYLTLQKTILKVDVNEYTEEDQIKNKKVFLYINKIKELNPELRAKEIRTSSVVVSSVANAKLNSLELAKSIAGKEPTGTTSLDSKGRDTLLSKLPNIAYKFALVLYLSLNTDSAKAKEALTDSLFSGVSTDSDKVIKALLDMSAKNILPKGKLNTKDANALVEKVLASITPPAGP